MPGFTAEEADEINGNYIRVPASWQGSSELGSLAGTPVKLRFVMRDTKLYSFQFRAREVKMKHVVERTLALFVTLLCACAVGQETPMSETGPRPGQEEDRAQLGHMRSAFIRAMNEGEVEKWIRSHLDAGVAVMPPGQPTISSRKEVVAWARGFLKENRIHEFAFTGSKTVTGDWAFENGVYLLESSPSAGGKKQGQRGKLIFIWKRGTDGWKGTLVSFNSDGYWP